MSYLRVGAVPVQVDWLNSALSPVVYGDIALSINTYIIIIIIHFSGAVYRTSGCPVYVGCHTLL